MARIVNTNYERKHSIHGQSHDGGIQYSTKIKPSSTAVCMLLYWFACRLSCLNGSLIPRLSPHPLFHTASNGKLGGTWERSCIPRPRPAFCRLQYMGETRSEATWSVHYYNVKPALAALHCLLRLVLMPYIPLWFY